MVNMKVRSELLVFLFLIYQAALLSISRRTIDLKGGTNDVIDKIVLSKITGMQEVTGAEVGENDVKFSILSTASENSTKSEGNVFFLLHGWSQSASTCPWYQPLTELLLKKYPTAQVVQVDYGKVVACGYDEAVFSSEGIGLVIAHMIHKMVKEGTSVEKIVLIGHSVGAQVAGWVGKEYRSLMNERLRRIIALDPAAPIFINRPDTRRLNKYDAHDVLVIHSDIKRFGFPKNCGTIDFYPNGGEDQPGCQMLQSEEAVWCSHRRAKDIFIAALKSPQDFLATNCDSKEDFLNHKCDNHKKVSMGDLESSAVGSYYLNTSLDLPFIN